MNRPAEEAVARRPMRVYGAIYLLGLVQPLLSILLIQASGIPFADGVYETGKYSVPAMGLLEHGALGRFENGVWQPEVQRLPVFLLFLAGLFALFGPHNYLPIVLVQALIAAGTVLVVARSAELLQPRLLWPAAIVAALTPGIGYYASIVHPEVLFAFFAALALLGLLGAIRGQPLPASLAVLAFATAMAMATRPAFLLAPALLSAGLFLGLLMDRRMDWRRAVLAALVPVLAGGLIYVGQGLSTKAKLGEFAYSTQSGTNLMHWVYPCLKLTLGCGDMRAEDVAFAEGQFQKRVKELPPGALDNEVKADRMRGAIATELILAIPPGDLLLAATGASLKMLFHTHVIAILERYGLERITPKQARGEGLIGKIGNYLGRLAEAPHMWLWALAQMLLFALRGVQIAGLVAGLFSARWRWLSVSFLLLILAFTAPALGLGNPRYRVPMEPLLVLLTVQGFWMGRHWLARPGNRDAAL